MAALLPVLKQGILLVLICGSCLASIFRYSRITIVIQSQQAGAINQKEKNSVNCTNATAGIANDVDTDTARSSSGGEYNVQVFVATSPKRGPYWERFYANSILWHSQFPLPTKVYTFDPIPSNSPIRKLVTPIELYDFERSMTRHSNLLLASFGQVYKDNPHADWYFFAEDDTIVVQENLYRLIDFLKDKHNITQPYDRDEVFQGKCVSVGRPNGKIPFAVGGAGILMSRALLQNLAPHVNECRHAYPNVKFGDARLGACIFRTLGRKEVLWDAHQLDRDNYYQQFDTCPPEQFSFTNGKPREVEVRRQKNPHIRKNYVVTMHVKDQEDIVEMHQMMDAIRKNNPHGSVTWQALKWQMDHDFKRQESVNTSLVSTN